MPSHCLSLSALGLYRWRIHGIQLGRIASSRTDHGYPAASQTAPSRRIVAALYFGFRPRRRASIRFPGGGPFKSRIAYFR
jgi:hypothetical protein